MTVGLFGVNVTPPGFFVQAIGTVAAINKSAMASVATDLRSFPSVDILRKPCFTRSHP